MSKWSGKMANSIDHDQFDNSLLSYFSGMLRVNMCLGDGMNTGIKPFTLNSDDMGPVVQN